MNRSLKKLCAYKICNEKLNIPLNTSQGIKNIIEQTKKIIFDINNDIFFKRDKTNLINLVFKGHPAVGLLSMFYLFLLGL